MRPIDAEKLEKDFTDWYDRAYPRDKELIEIAILSVEDAPTIEAEPVKHGRWKLRCYGDYPYCSNCNNEPKGREITLFCPNCGARMDGDKDNNVRNLTDEETAIYESWIESEAKDTDLNIVDGDSE